MNIKKSVLIASSRNQVALLRALSETFEELRPILFESDRVVISSLIEKITSNALKIYADANDKNAGCICERHIDKALYGGVDDHDELWDELSLIPQKEEETEDDDE